MDVHDGTAQPSQKVIFIKKREKKALKEKTLLLGDTRAYSLKEPKPIIFKKSLGVSATNPN